MMATKKTDVTEEEQKTYNSSVLSKFVWQQNPFGENGFLHVVFRSGEQYVYIGVPQDTAQELRKLACNPSEEKNSVGEFFNSEIRSNFDREDDYQRI